MQNWLSDRWLELFGLFGDLTDAQVEAAKSMGRADLTDDLAAIQQRRADSLAEIERKRGLTDEQHARELESRLAALRQSRDSSLAGIAAEREGRLTAAQSALADAQAAFAKARDEARKVASRAVGAPERLPDLAARVEAAPAVARETVESVGTFDKGIIAQIVGRPADKEVGLLESIDRKLERLVDNTRDGGYVF